MFIVFRLLILTSFYYKEKVWDKYVRIVGNYENDFHYSGSFCILKEWSDGFY